MKLGFFTMPIHALGKDWRPSSGTSFSSPTVAGPAALIKQVNPSASTADTISILHASGVRRDDVANSQIYSRVDIDNAIALANSRKGSPSSDVASAGLNSDLAYDEQTGDLVIPDLVHDRAPESALAGYLDEAHRILAEAKEPSSPDAWISETFEQLRWFELPEHCLA